MLPYRVKYNESEYDIQNNDWSYKIHQQCQNMFEMLENLENNKMKMFLVFCIISIIFLCIVCILRIYFVYFIYVFQCVSFCVFKLLLDINQVAWSSAEAEEAMCFNHISILRKREWRTTTDDGRRTTLDDGRRRTDGRFYIFFNYCWWSSICSKYLYIFYIVYFVYFV